MNQPMNKGSIVDPGSKEWFKTVSFGDLLKILALLAMVVGGYTQLKADIAHETEMRGVLETRTAEGVTEIRRIQGENTLRTEARFSENAQRDRELLAGMTSRMDRIENKVDLLLRRPALNGDGNR